MQLEWSKNELVRPVKLQLVPCSRGELSSCSYCEVLHEADTAYSYPAGMKSFLFTCSELMECYTLIEQNK